MDKSWMSKNRLCDEYRIGVESFMQFATHNVPDDVLISCPCTRCGNLTSKRKDLVRLHLLSNGIDLTYHTWIWHGERSASTHSMHHEDDQFRESIDMVHAAYEENNDDPSKFTQLLEDADKPLCDGCTKFSKLSAIVKLFNLKAKHSWSDGSFTDLLTIFGEMLPSPNELPPNIYEAKKSLVLMGLEYEKIHACLNDCILYRNEYAEYTSCPTCGASRWKKCSNNSMKNPIPAKVLWYFPPIPRFQRMFRNKDLSKTLTWHDDQRLKDGHLRHPADSPNWKVVDHRWPEFYDEPRHLRLALSADGINPHSLMNSKYSCWPVLLVIYNLPPWLIFKRKFIMLTLLISGPKQPGNDIDVYLRPLIEDLIHLWKVGVPTYDAFRDEQFPLKAVLLCTINDFPAYGNLSGCKVKGYHACPIYGEDTCAKRLKHSRKMSYTGHRRFLDQSHPYRRQKKVFDGTQELRPAPKPMSGSKILQSIGTIQCKWGKLHKTNKGEDKGIWKKKSVFFELEYCEHLHIRHCLDVMHIEKNICESLLGNLLDIPNETKDGLASRQDMVDMKIRTQLAPVKGEKGTYLPHACYTLNRAEKRKVCESFSRMKLSSNYSSNVHNLVSLKDSKQHGLKSHDCHTLMQQLLPVAIRGVLPDNVRSAITRLCLFFNAICSKVIDVSKLDDIQREIVKTLCLLEKYFPPAFFDIMVHLTVHLVREIKLCGPVWYRWMYPFERYMRVLKSYVRNRNKPEGCIAERYIAEEAVEFCSDYLSDVQTCGIPKSQDKVGLTKPLSSASVCTTTSEELMQAQLYILTNDIEIDLYISEHIAHLRRTTRNKPPTWYQGQHNRLFCSWLRERVAREVAQSGHQVSEKLRWIAEGPSRHVMKYESYLVNGVTFYTKERDSLRTVQNSGGSIVAKTMQVSSAKDKNPIVSDMIFYGVIEEIWELDFQKFRIPVFKCKWVENNGGIKVDDLGFTLVNLHRIGFKDDSFILASQAKQVFYIEDSVDAQWSVVLTTPSKEYIHFESGYDFEDILRPSFSKVLPETCDDTSDDNEPQYIRVD